MRVRAHVRTHVRTRVRVCVRRRMCVYVCVREVYICACACWRARVCDYGYGRACRRAYLRARVRMCVRDSVHACAVVRAGVRVGERVRTYAYMIY